MLWLETKIRNLILLFVNWVEGMSHFSSHAINRVGAVDAVVVHGNVLILLIHPVINHLILEVLGIHQSQESDECGGASDLVDLLLEVHHLL